MVSHVLAGQSRRKRFYQRDQLATEIQDALGHQIFQSADRLLAERYKEGAPHAALLLMTDKQRSVLQTPDGESAYTPYGHHAAVGECPGLLGFNGERPDPYTQHYLLGNGHRAFNPTLMRFNSPDSLSPFGKGGLNSYAYCQGDPVNRTDPTGRFHGWAWFTNGALGFVSDYVTPYFPRRLAQRIPGVGNKTFGQATKAMSAVSGLAATVLYLVMNRIEDEFPDSPANDPLFFAFLTTSAVGFLSGTGLTLHKLGRRPPRLQPKAGLRSRSQSQPNTGHDFGSKTPTPVINTNLDRFNLKMRFDQGEFSPDPVIQISTLIRQGFRKRHSI
nr:RHS repeat-associated core domain-containing protein [Pseudomonas sp. PB120]